MFPYKITFLGESNSFLLNKLSSYTNYTFQLNFKTPFGDEGHSNKINILTSKNRNNI